MMESFSKAAEVGEKIKEGKTDFDPDKRVEKSTSSLDKPEKGYDPDAKVEKNEGHGDSRTEKEIKENRMEPPIEIPFKCPDGCDPKEFSRQLKGQERGLNSQTVAENMKNREDYKKRKEKTGEGRAPEGRQAQETARQKALQSRIETNQKKGMSYSEAKAEAEGWLKTQNALHNPDQIAGGDPTKVSRMGDAKVNQSIGGQWGKNVGQLEKAVNEWAKGKTPEELANTKMNVKLVMEK